MKDKKKTDRFIEMRANNCTLEQISEELNLDYDTLTGWERQYIYEIRNKEAIVRETLNEKYCLSSPKKLELYGDVLLKLKDEVLKRDFSDIPTEKLLDFLPKYHSILKDYYYEPRYLLPEDIEEAKKPNPIMESLSKSLNALK